MKYDLAIIGAGPTGIMAAIQASRLGARVIVLEKNYRPGIKLLITGKGRCNITNNCSNIKDFVEKFGKNGRFLFSALSNFSIGDTINFFESLGVKTKVERGNRVFPISDSSRSVLNALTGEMKRLSVEIKFNTIIKEVKTEKNIIKGVLTEEGSFFQAENFLIATGGKSYPGTGSTGDGYNWLKSIGHKIVTPKPALAPIKLKESWVADLEGLSLKNVEISIYKNNKKSLSRFGEAMFTNDGMSGPIIIDMSKEISDLMPANLKLSIDFKPAIELSRLDRRLQKELNEAGRKLFKTVLAGLLPQKAIAVFLKQLNIAPDRQANSINKNERHVLIGLLKNFSLDIDGVEGWNKAVITAGGVSLAEVDPKTMKSKLLDNLYLAGEILDLDGPTGGYNLQVCWSTGYLAGQSAAKFKLG